EGGGRVPGAASAPTGTGSEFATQVDRAGELAPKGQRRSTERRTRSPVMTSPLRQVPGPPQTLPPRTSPERGTPVPCNCPSPDDLLPSHRGTLPEKAFEPLAAPLEPSPACAEALQRREATADLVVAALRRPGPTISADPDPTSPENWPGVPGYE